MSSLLDLIHRAQAAGYHIEGEKLLAPHPADPALLAEVRGDKERVMLALRAMAQADADNDAISQGEDGDEPIVIDAATRDGTRRWALAWALAAAGDDEAEAALEAAVAATPDWVNLSQMVSAAVEAGATITGWQEKEVAKETTE